jgi:hypothetical protein
LAIVGSDDNAVLSNRIGTNGLDIHWGNAFYGITVSGSGNSIKGNEIAYNGTSGGLDDAQAGVMVDGAGLRQYDQRQQHPTQRACIRLDNVNHNLVASDHQRHSQVQGTACANC